MKIVLFDRIKRSKTSQKRGVCKRIATLSNHKKNLESRLNFTMEKITRMKTTIKLMLLFTVLIFFISCTQHQYFGRFLHSDDNYFEMYKGLEVNRNGTFFYCNIIEFTGILSSGKWKETCNKYILNSNISDYNNFPLLLECISADNVKNKIMITLKNINWKYYDWYCIANSDTVKISSDTLCLYSSNGKTTLRFFVEPIGIPSLRELPHTDNCIVYRVPLVLSVQSQKLEINETGKYTISCDSIFGNNPLHYVIFKDYVIKKRKGNLVMKTSGYVLEPYNNDLSPCGYLNEKLQERVMSN